MDAEINNVIHMELNSGPKIANSTCGKTIDVETIDRDSTVFSKECKLWNLLLYNCSQSVITSVALLHLFPSELRSQVFSTSGLPGGKEAMFH